MVLDQRKKGRVTQLFGQKSYLETAPAPVSSVKYSVSGCKEKT